MVEREYRVRDLLILEEDRKKSIKIGEDKFIIKAPFPREQQEIARRLAMDYNGLPVTSFSLDDRYLFTQLATLDVLIVEAPSWWTTAENCPDAALRDALYDEIQKWSDEFQTQLKKNKLGKRGAKAQV